MDFINVLLNIVLVLTFKKFQNFYKLDAPCLELQLQILKVNSVLSGIKLFKFCLH